MNDDYDEDGLPPNKSQATLWLYRQGKDVGILCLLILRMLVVALDISGSISDQEFYQAIREVLDIVKNYNRIY